MVSKFWGPFHKEDFINKISEKVENNEEAGFAGFAEKKYLEDTLNWSIFDRYFNFDNANLNIEYNEKEIIETCKKTLKECQKEVNDEGPLYVYIFPTLSSFVKEKMSGSTGLTSYKNVMCIFISDNYDLERLKLTVAHEFVHTISYRYNVPSKIIDSIVFEGLAEKFSEKMVGIRSDWSKTLDKKESIDLFSKLPLEKEGWDEVRELFTKGDKYKMWAGYSIAYYTLVEGTPFVHTPLDTFNCT